MVRIVPFATERVKAWNGLEWFGVIIADYKRVGLNRLEWFGVAFGAG